MGTLFMIDKQKGYNGNVISTVHNGKVDYSGTLYNNDQGDLTIDEYGKLKGLEPLVLTWNELEPLIRDFEQKNLITNWKEIEEEFFYKMFEVLPPLRMTRTRTGFFFFISEMTSGNISACYMKDGERFFTASKRVSDPTGKIMVEFENDLREIDKNK